MFKNVEGLDINHRQQLAIDNDNNELYFTREHLQQSVPPGVSDIKRGFSVIIVFFLNAL